MFEFSSSRGLYCVSVHFISINFFRLFCLFIYLSHLFFPLKNSVFFSLNYFRA